MIAKKMLIKADKHDYAIPHFNISNLETMQAVHNVITKNPAPVFIATSESAIKYAGLKMIKNMFDSFNITSDRALHLDHGKDMEIIRKCIKIGYDSIMIDASHEKFEKNIRITKKVVDLAHKKDIAVEAELGTIGGKEDYIQGKIIYTDPKEAKEFVEKTGCDSLAVAIGTSHGAYKFPGKSHLNINCLKQVHQIVKVPLVLHGSSAVPATLVNRANKYGAMITKAHGVRDVDVRKAVKNGISKINIDTDLRLAFNTGIRKHLMNNPSDLDYRKILGQATLEMEKIVLHKLKVLGTL